MNKDGRRQLSVAIVGSGPAALYAAAELTKPQDPRIHVNMIDRLPTIGGLVRAGVAPDHADRRGVIDVYEKIARSAGRFEFFGNVEVGKHLSHADLLRHHHAVIYAVGASGNRSLDIPGKDLAGCHPSNAFVGWYNGHPDFSELPVSLDCDRAVVIGNGNVALDVARILLKDKADLATSDIADHALRTLADSQICEVLVLGRRGPGQAAFSHPELLELGELRDVDIQVDEADLADARWDETDFSTSLKKATLGTYAGSARSGKAKRLILKFFVSPLEILGETHVEGIRLARNHLVSNADGSITAVSSGTTEDLSAGLVVHAIGYRSAPPADLPFDREAGVIPNRSGRIWQRAHDMPMPGGYVVGWVKRGPRGVIGSNKICAKETVSALIEDARNGRLELPERPQSEFAAFVNARQPALVSYRGWRAIDRHEREQAYGRRPRSKLTRIAEMVRVAHSASPIPGDQP